MNVGQQFEYILPKVATPPNECNAIYVYMCGSDDCLHNPAAARQIAQKGSDRPDKSKVAYRDPARPRETQKTPEGRAAGWLAGRLAEVGRLLSSRNVKR